MNSLTQLTGDVALLKDERWEVARLGWCIRSPRTANLGFNAPAVDPGLACLSLAVKSFEGIRPSADGYHHRLAK